MNHFCYIKLVSNNYVLQNSFDRSHPCTWTLLAILILERSIFLQRLLHAAHYWKVGPDHKTTMDYASIHPAVICPMLIEVFVLFKGDIILKKNIVFNSQFRLHNVIVDEYI